ncbi:hypothetical protein PSI9734_02399 [Pseudidiomarina piscicola]|uniref:DUF2059 domain-containing protein n=1 Tax=Pseudidiomarina piscicola TaxID=2614830 RepID=A0A6S6WR56_9GAMM|nr:hypothetical protein [Pseudidiomarina piscicola]CAB0152050.1 hypothetical protein PSI9734_02399 [Pseudidiomarina piscicola]VZT41492.1 hypothetical protein PSI9734_02399 [Pseudomonas aeruginosa]
MRTTTALIIATSLLFPLSASAMAIQDSISPTERVGYSVDEDNERLVNTYLRMFRYYTKRNFSVTRTVRVLMSNYPQHVEPILHAAFERYPKNYEHIIKAAIDAEPGFTHDIMAVAMHLDIAPATELVRIAVEAEPAYADQIVAEASRVNPTQVEELVRVAIRIEPEMADSVMQSASTSQPEQVEGIVHATLSMLPAVGDYLVSSLNDLISLIGGSNADANPAAGKQEAISVIRGAYRAGMNYEELEVLAARHGINDQELATAVKASTN